MSKTHPNLAVVVTRSHLVIHGSIYHTHLGKIEAASGTFGHGGYRLVLGKRPGDVSIGVSLVCVGHTDSEVTCLGVTPWLCDTTRPGTEIPDMSKSRPAAGMPHQSILSVRQADRADNLDEQRAAPIQALLCTRYATRD